MKPSTLAQRKIPAKSGYLPSLDGWRAIAILGVLMVHDTEWTFAGHSGAAFQAFGTYGVNLFFAISGLLITTRILEEEKLQGHFQIKLFYVRRLFRIQPAATFYLAVVAVLMLAKVVHDHWYYWVAAMFMFENFAWHISAVPEAFFEGHFWTLAVEEHFYVLLSAILFFLRKGRFLALTLLWVGLYAAEIVIAHGSPGPDTLRRSYWQLDYLIFAAMLAVALQREPVRLWAVRYWKPWVAFTATILAAVLHHATLYLRHPSATSLTIAGWLGEMRIVAMFFFTLWVAATMLHARSWTTRLLEMSPLRWIGRLSYSLYLWHVLFFSRLEPATEIHNRVLLALSGRPAKYIAALAASVLSYYLLEKPMMRLGHRLAPPATPGRMDLIEEPAKRGAIA